MIKKTKTKKETEFAGFERRLKMFVESTNQGVERRLGVLIEATNHNVQLISEQYGDVKKDIAGIKETLDIHTEMIGELATNLEIVKTDIEFIKGDLKKKVDVDEFMALERRVAALEKRR